MFQETRDTREVRGQSQIQSQSGTSSSIDQVFFIFLTCPLLPLITPRLKYYCFVQLLPIIEKVVKIRKLECRVIHLCYHESDR